MKKPIRWHAARIRQLRHTAKKLNRLTERGIVSEKLQEKLKRQWALLSGRCNIRSLTHILSGAALMLVMGMAQGQVAFNAPVANPWGYVPSSGPVTGHQNIAVADIDNDGDFDFFVTDYYNRDLRFFENTGTSTSPSFAAPVLNPYGLSLGQRGKTTHFADMDNDGDLDVLMAAYEFQTFNSVGWIMYQENTGTPSAPSFAASVRSPFGLSILKDDRFITSGDLDNDGDIDLIMGDFLYASVSHFQNTGTSTAPSFAPRNGNFFNLTPGQLGDRIPALVDFDADGDMDLLYSDEMRDFHYHENTGTNSSPFYAPRPGVPFGLRAPTTNPAWGAFFGMVAVDIDGDGDEDIIASEWGGVIHFYESTPNVVVPVDPEIQFSSTSLTVDEPTAGTISVAINISNPNGNATTADVRLAGASTASQNTDFILANPTQVTLPPNSTSPVSLSIPILNDNWVEPDETIILELVNPGNNAILGPDSVFTITIRSEDFVAAPPAINFTSAGASVNEASGSYTISAQLTSPVNQQVEVTVASGPLSTAIFGQDYTLSANRFVFPPNSTTAQTITVNLINDPDDEMDELLSLRMTKPVGGVPLGDTSTFNLEILDDDYAVGLERLEAELGLSVSPNPASSFIDIQLAQPARLRCTLRDMQGKIVLSREISGMTNRLDLAGVSAGVYLLHIEAGERNGSMKLIIR